MQGFGYTQHIMGIGTGQLGNLAPDRSVLEAFSEVNGNCGINLPHSAYGTHPSSLKEIFWFICMAGENEYFYLLHRSLARANGIGSPFGVIARISPDG